MNIPYGSLATAMTQQPQSRARLPLGYEVALGGFIMCGVLFCLVSFIVKKAGTGWLDVLFPPAAMGAIVAVIRQEEGVEHIATNRQPLF